MLHAAARYNADSSDTATDDLNARDAHARGLDHPIVDSEHQTNTF